MRRKITRELKFSFNRSIFRTDVCFLLVLFSAQANGNKKSSEKEIMRIDANYQTPQINYTKSKNGLEHRLGNFRLSPAPQIFKLLNNIIFYHDKKLSYYRTISMVA
jgi:hypothetical protein